MLVHKTYQALIRKLLDFCDTKQRIFLIAIMSKLALRPTQPPIKWLQGAVSLGIKCLGHEVDHSPPPVAKVKKV
jgi:hypothetical protein